ncbi:MAG: hypothetical protein H0W50_07510 [Parachlamydiaceae bacterium]|nr:hypothetical protein [Parachlamydiaceae bacterium]
MFVLNSLRAVYSSASAFVLPTEYLDTANKVKEVIHDIFSSSLPNAFCYSMNLVNGSPVLFDLVSGAASSVAGSYMLFTIYYAEKIKTPASTNSINRRIGTLVGAISTIYGIFTLSTLLSKLFSNIQMGTVFGSQINISHPFIYYGGPLPVPHNTLYPEDLTSKAQILLETFLKCPDAKALYENTVNKEGPLSIRFEDPLLDELIAKSHGYWNTEAREIVIDSTKPHLQFHILIYEMINAAQSKNFQSIFEEASLGHLDALGYAKSIEKFEYETSKEHCLLTVGCIEQGAWALIPRPMPRQSCISKFSEDFETRWEKIKHQPHTQIYIDSYNAQYGNTDMESGKTEL